MPLVSHARHRAGEAANWALVVALAGSAQAEIWTDGDPSVPRAAAALIFLAATVPLAWRATAPVAVAVIVAVSIFVGSVGLADDYGASFQAWVALLVALYSVAAHADKRGRLLGTGAIAGSVGGFQLAEVLRGNDVEGIPGIWLSLAVAFLLGRLRRWQLLESVRLRSRAARLEQEQEEKARRAVAQERARIACELHDVVAHHLTSRSSRSSRPSESFRRADGRMVSPGISAPPRRAAAKRSARCAACSTYSERRTPSPSSPRRPGLRRSTISSPGVRKAGLMVEIVVEGSPADLPAGLDLTAYRIVQEALTNALKHTRVAPTRLTLRYGPEAIEVEVVDEGRGPPADGAGSGRGLVGMRERVALYGGRLEAGPRNGGGFRIWACLPLAPDAP